MDHALEAGAERVRYHLRRPIPGRRNLLMDQPPETPLTRYRDGLTVNVAMRRDFTFDPDKVTVKFGTTVLFRFYNSSSVVHDAFIGDQAAQDAREQAMVRRGLGHGGMDDANGVAVAPGGRMSLSYHSSHPGTLLLGCHELGHFAAGMKATIIVT